MDSVIRAVIAYFFLTVLLRIAGKRTVAQTTTFDLVLLIVIGQGIQYGLVGQNYSLTNAILIVGTLIGMELLVRRIAHRFEPIARWVDGSPLIVVDNGRLLEKRAHHAGVTEEDVLESARVLHGLERMDQIKFAVLERTGQISIIPRG